MKRLFCTVVAWLLQRLGWESYDDGLVVVTRIRRKIWIWDARSGLVAPKFSEALFRKVVSWLLRRPYSDCDWYEDAVVWEDRFGIVEIWYDWNIDQIMATTAWWYTVYWDSGSRPRIETHFVTVQEARYMGP